MATGSAKVSSAIFEFGLIVKLTLDDQTGQGDDRQQRQSQTPKKHFGSNMKEFTAGPRGQ
mgnify:CR=1 FL=1